MSSASMDAIATAAAIRQGDLSIREVIEGAIARIEKHNPVLNAVIARRFDEALAEMDRGLPDGPLRGVPILIKDLGMQVSGLPATRGSRLWADCVGTVDSELVARYRRAGMVVLGTTNTPEFGLSCTTEPVLHGPTRNPWRTTHSSGGSSGGSAAAVSAGLVPVAHGSDGGGSLRIPASMCGLFGLKPTRGRVTTAPEPVDLAAPLSVHHAVTRTVRDSAALLDLAAVPLPGDALAAPSQGRTFTEQMTAEPGRLRIGLATRRADGGDTSPQVTGAARSVAELCERMGHQVDEVELDYDPVQALGAMSVLMGVNLLSSVEQRLAQLGRELRDGDLEPFTMAILEHNKAMTGTAVYDAMREAQSTGWRFGRMFTTYDVLLTPTLPLPAPELGVIDTTRPEAMYTVAGDYSSLTSFVNVTGQPAMSVPFGLDSDGLPIGVQFIADMGREGLLLSLAARIEEAAPWPLMAPDFAD